MDLPTYLATLRKNWLALLVVAVLGALVGLAAYATTPKSYATTVDFYVSTPTSQNTNPQASGEFAESRVNSYILLLSSEQLAQRVVATSGVDLTPLQVSSRVTASAKLSTVVINTTVTDENPARSLRIAQGVAADFGSLVDDLDNVGRSTPVVVIHVVSGPTLKGGSVSPDPRLYIGAGLLAGLVVGLGLALLRGARQRKLPGAQADSADSGFGSVASELGGSEPGASEAAAAGSTGSGSAASDAGTHVEDDPSWHWHGLSEGDDAQQSVSVASER